MSCTELIRATTHTSAINQIKKVAATYLITRFYLPQIYNMKNKQTWQHISITIVDGSEDDILLRTTETLRNIMGSDKLKHVWRAAGNTSEFVRDALDETAESIASSQTVETASAESVMVIDQ